MKKLEKRLFNICMKFMDKKRESYPVEIQMRLGRKDNSYYTLIYGEDKKLGTINIQGEKYVGFTTGYYDYNYSQDLFDKRFFSYMITELRKLRKDGIKVNVTRYKTTENKHNKTR
jgi:hypothetical protein